MRKLFLFVATMMAVYIATQEVSQYLDLFSKVRQDLGNKAPPPQFALAAVPLPTRKEASVQVSEAPAKVALSPIEIAEKYLDEHRSEWKLQPYHTFRSVEFVTPIGTKVKFSVFQGEVPVLDTEIQLQIGRDGSVIEVQNRYRSLERANLEEKALTVSEIANLHRDRYQLEEPVRAPPPVLFVHPASNRPELAYLLSVKERSGNEMPVQILFRASDGQILQKSFSRSEF